MRSRYFLWLLPLALGCSSAEQPAPTDGSGLSASTGLEGVVRRGPIQPVCWPDAACEAPFAARFEVRAGERLVTRFRSDSAGHFFVRLAPGDYTVAPDSSAPGLGIMWQTHAVAVGSTGITHVDLDFDTGIR